MTLNRYLKWKWELYYDVIKNFDALSRGYIAYSLYPLALLHEFDRTLAGMEEPPPSEI
jgi:hypothetical protein